MKTSRWLGRAITMTGATLMACWVAHAASQNLNYTVSDSRGSAKVTSGDAASDAKVGDSIKANSTVTTDDSVVGFSASAGGRPVSVLQLWESSSLTFLEFTVNDEGVVKADLNLLKGTLAGVLAGSNPGSTLSLEAGPTKAVIQGSFLAKSDGSIYCFTGNITLKNGGSTYKLLPNQYFDPATSFVLPFNFPAPIAIIDANQPIVPNSGVNAFQTFVQVVSPTTTTSPTQPTGGSIKK